MYNVEQLREWREGTVTYGGSEMSVYDATQKQRGMERAIRKSKQELVAYDEALKNVSDEETKTDLQLEFDRISVKLKGQEAKLRDFCNKTGLDRDRYREQVFAAKTESGIHNFGKSTSAKAVWGNRKFSLSEHGISGKHQSVTKENVVDLKYLDSKEYKSKFKSITDNNTVNTAIYKYAKAILTHRNGTYYEDLYLIDAETGISKYIISNAKFENAVDYTQRAKSIISKNPYKLISIHNHGTNNPPTGNDIVSASGKKYSLGVVVCHDGKVFTYTAAKKPFLTKSFSIKVEIFKKNGYTEYDAIRSTLEQFSKDYVFEWREL